MRQVIAITGMDDRDQPDQAIAITGIRGPAFQPENA
jgi:nicotinamide mononucleotide (NMN) deamidase PncC